MSGATLDTATEAVDTANWLQIEPQYCWHSEAYIRGNASALRAFAKALLAAADGAAATSETIFAGDGEGYRIEVLRVERPDDLPQPFYTVEIDRLDYQAGGKTYCGKCGRPQDMPSAGKK
jgi:hypothetical protein